MPTPSHVREKTAQAYNTASDAYDHPANTFWERFGRGTIDRLPLKPGMRLLDVCCGSGASAIPAAEKVGPDGSVLGIDLAENLLALARAKAQARGLTNIEFRTGDMLDLDLPDSHFDAVTCVFGIFFAPDMPSAVTELWRLVKPSGLLAITTWGPRLFEPINAVFWESVRQVRSDLYKGFNPWDRISDPDSLQSLLASGGVTAADIVAEVGTHKINSPDDWWALVMGSGYRGTIEQLSPTDQKRVQEMNFAYIREADVREVEANVIYAVARKA
jgi:ubiquinone/menaquinone biosynthesis C-methylase UbiE